MHVSNSVNQVAECGYNAIKKGGLRIEELADQQSRRIDHYTILRPLGQGGMSRVYLARDVRTEQQVVLKFPNDDMLGNVAIFERYRREAEIGSLLNHPHIQRLLNTDEERGEPYLVMEYIQGRSLRDVLNASAPALLDQGEALRIVLQVGDALAYAHEHGVFHRDIKPENILVRDDGETMIIDFGIALLEGARRVTWRGLSATVGTPAYMSPEQLRGERGSGRSDIYAVGTILYELLCGRTPFQGEEVGALISRHAAQEPPSITDYTATLSPALATVVMRAIRRDAEERYGRIEQMMYDLRHLDEVTPVDALLVSPKHDGRYRQVLGMSFIVLVVVLGIIVLGVLAQLFHHVIR